MCVYSSVLEMFGIQLAPSQQQNAPIHIEPKTCQPERNCFLLHIRLSRQQKRTLLSILGSILLFLYAMQSLVTIQLAKDTTMKPNVDATLETPSASEVAAGKWWACYSLTVEQPKSKSTQLRQKHQLMLFLPAQVIQHKMVWVKLRPESLHIQERYHTGKKENFTLLHLAETINIATCPEL